MVADLSDWSAQSFRANGRGGAGRMVDLEARSNGVASRHPRGGQRPLFRAPRYTVNPGVPIILAMVTPTPLPAGSSTLDLGPGSGLIAGLKDSLEDGVRGSVERFEGDLVL